MKVKIKVCRSDPPGLEPKVGVSVLLGEAFEGKRVVRDYSIPVELID
jgi:hypothetical protein